MRPLMPSGKKSHSITPPIKEVWFIAKDYLRGLYDADGSLGLEKTGTPFISLCTNSEAIRNFIGSEIEALTGFVITSSRNKRDSVYNIKLSNEKAQIFSYYLYKGSELHLDRKYTKWLQDVSTWERTSARYVQSPRRRWEEAEVVLVKDPSLSLQEIIKLTGRTRTSIQSKIKSLRLKGNI